MVLALSLVAGLSAPLMMLPQVHAATPYAGPTGVTELSPAPVNQITAVPPNIAVTFDDSGSMAWNYMGDRPPFGTTKGWGSGPWYCASVIDPAAKTGIDTHVMNGVYYNPNVPYNPPVKADGGDFPGADDTLKAVWNDGIAVNRPLGGSSGTTDFTGTVTQGTGWYWNGQGSYTDWNNWVWGTYPTGSGYYSNNRHSNPPDKSWQIQNGPYPTNDNRWTCPYDYKSPIASGGPYYYEYTGPAITTDKYGNPDSNGLSDLYNQDNWTAVAVPASQYQNWANWWAYYHTRNLMARTALSRVFGSTSLSATTATGGYGNDMRVAWQNLYTYDTFTLDSDTIISALIDQDPANCNKGGTPPALGSQSLIAGTSTRTSPDCYRSDFFNWIYQVPAQSGTPLRSALVRAGKFFQRGSGNTGVTGDLHDPYWQPPQHGTYNATSNPGNELYCRQNFTILITDGLWNGGQDGPQYSNLTLPTAGTALPDGVVPPSPTTAGVTSIYAPVHDGGNSGYASLSDIAYHYWATNLRPDLYLGGTGAPKPTDIVPPYMLDTTTGLFGNAGNVTGGYGAALNVAVEEYFNPKNDPATWPHMADYMIGLGVSGVMNFSENTDCKSTVAADLDACDLRKGDVNSTGSTGWPTPNGDGNGITANIDDTWHAALAGRGQFFSAGNPTQLVEQLTSVLSNIAARASPVIAAATNVSVASIGALSFSTGYNKDWSGVFQAKTLNTDGTLGAVQWDAGAKLDAVTPSGRNIYTDAYSSSGFSAFAFTAANSGSLDSIETAGLLSPAILSGSTTDTLANRIDYLRGDKTHEADNTYRKRDHILGAIIHSQPLYVSYPTGNYYGPWPSGSVEATAAAASTGTDDKSYDSFVVDHADRAGTVYVGANDGMLHAFAAPVPTCTSAGACTYGNGGTELWAFIPRAVYANLGNLTSVSSFKFRPTVDATPVEQDVFFGEAGASNTDDKWHTILAGGVGVGGRGVYALDITDPTTFSNSDVLWEFDADMPNPGSSCTAISGTSADSIGCRSSDLGFTVSQPNIGRLDNGKWAVLVSNGYFPDCSKPDIPTIASSCAAIAAQAPTYANGHPYSALFVLDAQTGKMIAELKTPDLVSSGVYSFGLATPVMGDYDNDQIDDVAFAGDLEGNLWRFDLSDANPSNWKVTLVYKGLTDASGNQGLQPITTMPRLFPDPSSNRFIVTFGTGKYLGADDNGTTQVQAVYGVRDPGASGSPVTQSDLVQQYLSESLAPAKLPDGSPNPNAGATLRCITGKAGETCQAYTTPGSGTYTAPNQIPATKAGWFFNLATYSGTTQTDIGEQVVVTPASIFATNTVVISTLMTGASGSDPCNPSTQGAIMSINANDGGPGSGVSFLGGFPVVGARANNVRTGGSLPIVSALGGVHTYIPGTTYSGVSAATGNTAGTDSAAWRRRSWSEINQN